MPGCIAAMYEELGGDVTYFGKPHASAFAASLELLGGATPPSRVLHVGDSLKHGAPPPHRRRHRPAATDPPPQTRRRTTAATNPPPHHRHKPGATEPVAHRRRRRPGRAEVSAAAATCPHTGRAALRRAPLLPGSSRRRPHDGSLPCAARAQILLVRTRPACIRSLSPAASTPMSCRSQRVGACRRARAATS
eukprot:1220833-Prymnesium_polylepis.2